MFADVEPARSHDRDGDELAPFGTPESESRTALPRCEWSITVIARNEEVNLPASLASIAEACSGRDALVTVLVNGSADRTVERAIESSRTLRLKSRVYSIPYGDKSNAWNQFVHVLRPNAGGYFFVDGHARIAPNSLSRLWAHLEENSALNAVSGSPLGSRSSAPWRDNLVRNGGITGNLHLLSRKFVDLIIERRFFLPVGLYRGDGLLNSFAAHDGDALRNPWNPSRAVALSEAVFYPLAWKWRPREIRRHWERRVRQGQGRLENAAIKWVIYSRNYSGLPSSVNLLVNDWIAHEGRAPLVRRDPFAYLAWQRLRRNQDPPPDELRASLVEALCG